MTELLPIMNRHVASVWPYVYLFIERVLKRESGETLTLLETYIKIINKELQLWVLWRDKKIVAAGLTGIEESDSGKACWIFGLGGSLEKDFLFCRKRVIDWARVMKCDFLRIKGRRGWKRIFKDMNEIEPGVLELKL